MTIDETIGRLYGLPLAEFTAARNAAAAELRRAGARDDADRVRALRKPTAAAGAVNRLVRERRAEVEEFLRAAAALRDAQFSGKGDLAAATRDEHDALERLTGLGGEEVRQSLLAAAVDDEAARRVLEGRLERELEPAGFGTLLAHVTPGERRLEPAKREKPAREKRPLEKQGPATEAQVATPRETPARKRPDDAAARGRLDEARSALEAAEAEERQARRHWDDTRQELDKARKAVDDALRELDRLQGD